MRILTSFVTSAALLITAGLTGCAPDPDDVFTSLTTTLSTTQSGDGDGDTTGDGDGDTGDGDPGDGDPGDGDPGDGDPGDGDGDGDACGTGMIGEACDAMCMCADGLTCDNTGFCSLGGGDGDGDGDGDPNAECNTYDPAMCPMGSLVMVGGLEGNFCGCPCASNADCPMGPPGTQGACALVLGGGMAPTNCGLICSLMDDACPAGATCKSAGQMDPDIGLCTFP